MTDERSEGTVASTRVEAIVGFLDGAGIPYELVEHESVMSAAAEARVAICRRRRSPRPSCCTTAASMSSRLFPPPAGST